MVKVEEHEVQVVALVQEIQLGIAIEHRLHASELKYDVALQLQFVLEIKIKGEAQAVH